MFQTEAWMNTSAAGWRGALARQPHAANRRKLANKVPEIAHEKARHLWRCRAFFEPICRISAC
jgi:hypothetical protein